MTDEWVKISSWHLRSGVMSRGGMFHTLCGKWAQANARRGDRLPGHEKSCESCFRNREIRDGQ